MQHVAVNSPCCKLKADAGEVGAVRVSKCTTVHLRLVVDAIPHDCVGNPCCDGCSHAEEHAAIKGNLQQAQHSPPLLGIGQVCNAVCSRVRAARVVMPFVLCSAVRWRECA